jgi:hypothetical protein
MSLGLRSRQIYGGATLPVAAPSTRRPKGCVMETRMKVRPATCTPGAPLMLPDGPLHCMLPPYGAQLCAPPCSWTYICVHMCCACGCGWVN